MGIRGIVLHHPTIKGADNLTRDSVHLVKLALSLSMGSEYSHICIYQIIYEYINIDTGHIKTTKAKFSTRNIKNKITHHTAWVHIPVWLSTSTYQGLNYYKLSDYGCVQSFGHVQLFMAAWTTTCQASLSLTSLLKFAPSSYPFHQ